MPKSHLYIKLFAIPYCFVLLLAFNLCFAQTTKVNNLQLKLKQTMPDTARLTVLHELTTAYSAVDPAKKFYYANVYKALAKKLHNEDAVADSYIQMGISHGIRSNIDSALYYFNLGYNHAKKFRFDLTAGRGLANMGFAYDRLDDSREAIKYYFQALAIYKRLNYTPGANQCYTNIGSIYFDSNKPDIAQTYFNQALAGHIKNKNEMGIAAALYSIGNCYRESKNGDDKAIEYYNRSLAIRQKLGDLNGIALAKMGLGRAYTDKREYNTAIVLLDSALKNIRIIGDKYVEANVLTSIADAYNGKKDYKTAVVYARQALAVSRSAHTKSIVFESMERLVTAYKGIGDLKQALYYKTESALTKDSIQEEKVLKDISLMEISRVRAENAHLEKSNQAISSQNSDYLVKINKYTAIIIATLIVLLSAILYLAILFRRNQVKKTTNKVLVKQKEEIAAINNELALLNDEVNTQMELTAAQNTELERLNDIKNKFFSIVSHDLRSPLSTLQTLLAVYRAGDIGEKELGELLVKLEDTILTTGTFLDNLLEWSKNQLEGIQINPVCFDVAGSIKANIALFETKIEMKKLKVSSLVPAQVKVFADKDMINLVIRNLLSNSIKFCNTGDEIIFSAQVKNNRTVVFIRDTGPGITEEETEKLFSLEHTLSIGTHGEKGNHLGLILCKDMITLNHGNIGFETELGAGATFWFELPGEKV